MWVNNQHYKQIEADVPALDENHAVPDDYYYGGYYPESPAAPTLLHPIGELEGISSDENDDNHFYI